ncbi:hypothetical protein [Mesobacillus subterraneus]|uniref:Uncharacterized protein n=1 Tax=Mesobacillus subterraneus TaxID=285983 RepID=A0A0D6ZF51_9BACI|nr:hypothetical protein [Mesobacillus subterraneus]KIY23890.1 hypothetical protein UB32_00390 [Mesobacillus subterraneus]
MKKGLKIFLAIFVVLLLALGGTAYYFLKVKQYDIADTKVEKITESDYQIELPGIDGVGNTDTASAENGAGGASEKEGNSGNSGSTESASGDGNGSSNNATSQMIADGKKADDGKKAENGTENAGQSGSDQKTDGREVTAESIKAAYRPVFESLEAQANGKIDGLVAAAYDEYKAKKESGESVSITYFYRKYSAAGKELESKTDETFQYVYNALEKDLQKHGINASEATEFKTQYENAKEARQSSLIEKAKSAL